MKPSKQPQPTKPSAIKQSLLGLYGIVGITVSTIGLVKVPFAESNAKEYWRHALVGLFIILLLLAGIISLALYMFDANYFKSQMVDYVKTHTQRDLTLEGDIKVTFFPKLGLDSGKMALSQRNSSKNFASIENARLYVAWWPLLRKQLQVESVELEGLHTNIIHYKNNSSNLDDLFAIESSLGDITFEIDSIKLKNSSANLHDETSGVMLALHDLNLETGKLADSVPGKINTSFRLESSKPHIDAKVKLDSHVIFELKSNHFEFANFEAEIEGEAAGLNNLSANIQGTLNSYPAEEKLAIDKLSANIKGKFEVRKIEAKLNIPKLQLVKNKLSGNTITLNATLLQDEESLSATLDLPAVELADKQLKAENMSANFDIFKAGSSLQGKLNSPLSINFDTQLVQLPTITGSFNGTHPLLLAKLGASFNGNMQANIPDQNIKFDFNSRIDDSNITGSLSLQDFSHPAYNFNMGANMLDLDRYLAVDLAKRMQNDSLPFDFSALKELNLRGKIRCNEFKFTRLKANNLVADIKIDPSSLTLDPLNAHLYGGTATGSFSILTSEIPQFTFKQKLAGVQLNALLSDITPGDPKLVGKGNLALDLSATGQNMDDLRKTLNGSASLTLAHGSLAGLNLADALVANKGQLGNPDSEKIEAAKFTEATSFYEFKSSFEINEGKLHSSDFLMKSPLFSSKGEGDISLESGQLNYRLDTSLASTLKSGSNGELAELKGINIPMKLSGNYAAPSIIFDFVHASGGNLEKLIKSRQPPVQSPAPVPVATAEKRVKKKKIE